MECDGETMYEVEVDGEKVASCSKLTDSILLLGVLFYVLNLKVGSAHKNIMWFLACKLFGVAHEVRPDAACVESMAQLL